MSLATSAGEIKNLKLNDGNEIPMLAYGLGSANFRKENVPRPELVDRTVSAIKAGFLHLDGAEAYGNEEQLGAAIAAAGVPREKLFVTTKLRDNLTLSTAESLDASLARLGLDYVDLYLIHSPYFAVKSDGDTNTMLQKQWAEMEECQRSGKARSIGVSNFLIPHLEAVLETAKVVPAINQIELHPYLQHYGKDGKDPTSLTDYHREKGIATSAYGPLTAVVRARPGPLDGVYARLAEKYGVSEADVALRWIIDPGFVAITTSSNEERMKGYMANVPKFSLTSEEVKEIARVGREKHHRAFARMIFEDDDMS